jgi:uncharacterized protein
MTTAALFFRSRRFWIWSVGVATSVWLLGMQPVYVHAGGSLGLLGQLLPAAALLPFACAMACEYLDSSLGMGYGTLMTPLLMLMGHPARQIVPCILLSELVTGVLASALHFRDGNVDYVRDDHARKASLLLSSLSAVGALVGVAVAVKLPGPYLNIIITMIVLGAGLFVLLTARQRLNFRPSHLIGLGAVAAFNKALSGGGYGPLVTSGQVVCGMSAKKAVAITSLAESLVCVVGLATYLAIDGTLDRNLVLSVVPGAVLAVPMATLTIRVLSESTVRFAVGVVTVGLGILALLKVASI